MRAVSRTVWTRLTRAKHSVPFLFTLRRGSAVGALPACARAAAHPQSHGLKLVSGEPAGKLAGGVLELRQRHQVRVHRPSKVLEVARVKADQRVRAARPQSCQPDTRPLLYHIDVFRIDVDEAFARGRPKTPLQCAPADPGPRALTTTLEEEIKPVIAVRGVSCFFSHEGLDRSCFSCRAHGSAEIARLPICPRTGVAAQRRALTSTHGGIPRGRPGCTGGRALGLGTSMRVGCNRTQRTHKRLSADAPRNPSCSFRDAQANPDETGDDPNGFPADFGSEEALRQSRGTELVEPSYVSCAKGPGCVRRLQRRRPSSLRRPRGACCGDSPKPAIGRFCSKIQVRPLCSWNEFAHPCKRAQESASGLSIKLATGRVSLLRSSTLAFRWQEVFERMSRRSREAATLQTALPS
ncbi:hypothetical protein SAMN05216567_113119 [Variovorax sp. OK605]|nr:hypothetical protein SAMN05216567_113119 [Variovorax sp. OK605]